MSQVDAMGINTGMTQTSIVYIHPLVDQGGIDGQEDSLGVFTPMKADNLVADAVRQLISRPTTPFSSPPVAPWHLL